MEAIGTGACVRGHLVHELICALATYREIAEQQHVRPRSLERRQRLGRRGDGRDLGAVLLEHRPEGFAEAEIVIDEQHADAGEPAAARPGSPGASEAAPGHARQIDGEGRAPLRTRALGAHATAVELDEVLDDAARPAVAPADPPPEASKTAAGLVLMPPLSLTWIRA